MGASRNQESTRQEKDGVVYYDRGILTGKDGKRYQRFAIHTHFVQPGEDQAELVRRYVLPLYQPGDCLSFTAKVMGMCTNNVRTLEDTHPGFWARTLAPFAGHNSTGIGMHQPYKMQLVSGTGNVRPGAGERGFGGTAGYHVRRRGLRFIERQLP